MCGQFLVGPHLMWTIRHPTPRGLYTPPYLIKKRTCILGLCGPMFMRHVKLVKELIFVFG